MGLAPQRHKMNNRDCTMEWGTLQEAKVQKNGDVEAIYLCDADHHHTKVTFKAQQREEKLTLGNSNAYQPTDLEEF